MPTYYCSDDLCNTYNIKDYMKGFKINYIENDNGGNNCMFYIKDALCAYCEDYDADTMEFKSGKFNGVKFCDRLAETGDFCIDVINNRILLCVESAGAGWLGNGYFVGFEQPNTIRDIRNKQIIPINATNEIIMDFLDSNTFIGNCYLYTKRTIKKTHPNFEAYIKTELCKECGMPIKESSSYNIEGKYICEDCFEEKYSICDRCGKIFKIEENNKDSLCPSCAKREYVLPYHRYAPEINFYGNNYNNSVPYLGVELEVDEGGESDRTVKQLMKIVNSSDRIFAYCMHDGSLHEGFEIITQPATLKYHTSIKGMYEQAFKFLLKKGYLSHDTATCGIHVHFNRDFYSENEELYITRLLYLVDKFWDEIVKFSRRNQRRIDRYSKKVDVNIHDYYKRSNKSGDHDYHYYAVNLANQNTIEFRMFKGSLNIDTFMATLQFVHNCIVCAKEKTAEEIQQMEFEELITGRACKTYWKTRKNRINTEE